MAAQRQYSYTPEQYLEIERKALFKSEFYEGRIFAMAGASEAHGFIITNISSELRAAFKGLKCRVNHSDMRINVAASGLFTYADLSVLCEQSQFVEDRRPDTLINPLLIVEVLSQSTEAYDRGKKFANYQLIPSLQEYVLVSQTNARVESYRRQSDGKTWLLTTAVGLESTIKLTSVNVDLVLAEVYDRVEFSPDPPTSEDREPS